MATFKLTRNSLQQRFMNSRGKVQLYGGGFANGKTATACIKTLEVARDYPGANILMARSTYPKLNDTLRKEFLKWCPSDWIKSFPKSANGSNTCTLTNGTTINFRYIQQQGKTGTEATTSNLLSATYDMVVVDQMEDPEIVHKDFLDLLGRLRGMTPYVGTDPTMPRNGPRWFIITTNPTRNWLYRKLVKPLHDLLDYDPMTKKKKTPIINDDLLCETDDDGKMLKGKDGKPIPIIDLYEGSTYENKDNLEKDFIKTLESSYRGQMRTRFLMGQWSSYEGLVYPTYSDAVHVMSHRTVEQYYRQVRMTTSEMTILEGYDYGLAVPYCYLLGFTDAHGNVFLMDGEYEKEVSLDDQIEAIKNKRAEYDVPDDNTILADPSIFKRTVGKKLVGKSISNMMLDEGLYCERGNNAITNGIVKVNQYLIPQRNHKNPITGEYESPYIYISDKLEFWINEISDYYWKKTPTGDQIDEPVDRNDHAMDTTKYMLSDRPNIAKLTVANNPEPVGWLSWGERDIQEERRSHRHG